MDIVKLNIFLMIKCIFLILIIIYLTIGVEI